MFKSKKKVVLPPPPRDLEAIKTEYSQLVSRAGQLQYQSYVQELELAAINEQLVRVNNEAKARQDLDKAAAPLDEEKAST